MRSRVMNKPMLVMLVSLGILFGGIFIYKGISSLLLKHYFATHKNPAMTVSTTKVQFSTWQPTLKAVGSAAAILGVSVTTELAGMVQKVYFKPGSLVQEGAVLVQLNADAEVGQLQSLQAQAELARITYKRDELQYSVKAISKQVLDTDKYNLQNLEGQVAQQVATVAKKTIRAPFAGRLGIVLVFPGQYLNVGDPVTTLQTLNPIYVDFYLPQQALAQLKMGQEVTVSTDAFPDTVFTGKITTIQPLVDTATRNVEVEATIDNPSYMLTPGMFTTVEVKAIKPEQYLTLPQAAISYNSYGDIVYVVNEAGKDKSGKPILIAKQVFVKTGDTRGDQIAILQGLKAGQTVVTSGQLKLKNGTRIAINNTIQPGNSPAPKVTNEHV